MGSDSNAALSFSSLSVKGGFNSKNMILLQDIVSWDQYSLKIRGERIYLWAGEFHPFRLPVPGLWGDVFQKIKAMGYNGVSTYFDWALLEGKQGQFGVEPIFTVARFCEAAADAGLYLIARPGPYINAEVSGGGLPGWMQRTTASLRTAEEEYLTPALTYMAHMAGMLAPHQITRGGPIILFQIENEYTLLEGDLPLDAKYMEALKQAVRDNGIVVPFTFNDAKPANTWTPFSGEGACDIYGWDGYPFGYGPGVTFCSDPSYWPKRLLPSKLLDYKTHRAYSPSCPFFLPEFQGSTVQGWGSDAPQTAAADLINAEFERVFYKESLANNVRMIALYMTYGGTNWGNVGFPGTTTSYDEGAAISEDRLVNREKYSEAKLIANFATATPALLTSVPRESTNQCLISTEDLTLAISDDTQSATRFYTVRHRDYTSQASTAYRLTVETSRGIIRIPQVQVDWPLSLHGRDSKIHVIDYKVGPVTIVYSTGEVFTAVSGKDRTLLILYGGQNELHEFALDVSLGQPQGEFPSGEIDIEIVNGLTVIRWKVESPRKVMRFGDSFDIHLLSRNEAHRYWTINAGNLPHGSNEERIVLRAGYLIRKAKIEHQKLLICGDITDDTTIEAIYTPSTVDSIYFNGISLDSKVVDGLLTAMVSFELPHFTLPRMQELVWHYRDSLPELSKTYDDSTWTLCDLTSSNNPRKITTPRSLYGGDYGYHSGSLLYRGSFKATGKEKWLSITTAGGAGYGHSIWIDQFLIGSFAGVVNTSSIEQRYNLPKLYGGNVHVLTVLIDHMGYEMQFIARSEAMKSPRGILDYDINGERQRQSDITWKMMGNYGGEDFFDSTRGPLNEGALYAERQGWHLPRPPVEGWEIRSPWDGISAAGVGFFSAELRLNIPTGYDIPLSFIFDPIALSNFRCQIFVNGYQFGKFINNLGPQTRFPVPEGILNHRGLNYIAVTLWSLDRKGARLTGLRLEPSKIIQTGYGPIEQTAQIPWVQRNTI